MYNNGPVRVFSVRERKYRDTSPPLHSFAVPTERFQIVHLDLIGPLPLSKGNKYCLTYIDRFTCWAEAFPIPDMTAATVASTLYANWIARFGVPRKVVTDQGRQFESRLFHALSTLLGSKRVRTNAYHPQTNGKVERWHRTLKTALSIHGSSNWTESLPTVLLGLRSVLREDSGCTPAEMLYGQPLTLPGEFFNTTATNNDASDFITKLREHIARFKPVPDSRHSTKKIFVSQNLTTCSHVFVRNYRIRKTFQHPYNGPFKIVKRTDKYYTILLNNKEVNISLERLKLAFILETSSSTAEHDINAQLQN